MMITIVGGLYDGWRVDGDELDALGLTFVQTKEGLCLEWDNVPDSVLPKVAGLAAAARIKGTHGIVRKGDRFVVFVTSTDEDETYLTLDRDLEEGGHEFFVNTHTLRDHGTRA